MLLRIRTALMLLGISALVIGCANHPPLQASRAIDLQQFEGQWYVIANIPYFMEANKVATTTEYTHLGNGEFKDVFSFKEGDFDSERKEWVGSAKSLNDANTEWQSVFFWVLRSRFSIIHMDDNAQMMLVGVRSRDLGWVFSRSNQLSEPDYQRALNIFANNGYDVSRFAKVPQLPNQLGQPGFQTVE